jgi:hypothetical protein
MDASAAKKVSIALGLALLIIGVAVPGAHAKKHKRLRLTCDQTTEAIFQTAEQYRAKYNAMGFTIEDAPYGLLVGGGCKNVGKLTRQGAAYLADVHYADDGSPPFPGETNPDVQEYHWFWNEIVARTKKGRIRTTVIDFRCVKDIYTQSDIQEVPC